KLVVVEQGRKRKDIAADLAGEGGDEGVGPVAIGGLSGEVMKPGKDPDHRSVPGRNGAVGRVLHPDDEVADVVGGEEVAAIGAVPVVPIERLDPAAGLREIDVLAGCLVEGEGGAAEKRIVVEGGGMLCLAVAPAM